MDLQGQRVMIIGGGSGIGRAVAERAAAAGAQVIVAGRNRGRLEDVAARIGAAASALVVDAASGDSLSSAFKTVGALDHLVLSIHDMTSVMDGEVMVRLQDVNIDDAAAFMASKFWTQFRACQFGAPALRRGGSIILTSGDGSRLPKRNYAALGAINSAIEGFCKKAALELAPIRVNAVAPGLTRTDAVDELYGDGARADFYADYAMRLPLRRIPTADEIADGYLYLMNSPHVTGTIIDMDGGALIAGV